MNKTLGTSIIYRIKSLFSPANTENLILFAFLNIFYFSLRNFDSQATLPFLTFILCCSCSLRLCCLTDNFICHLYNSTLNFYTISQEKNRQRLSICFSSFEERRHWDVSFNSSQSFKNMFSH